LLLVKPDSFKAREALRAVLMKKFQEGGATSKIRMFAIKGQFEVQLRSTKDPARKAELCMKLLLDDPTNGKVRGLLAETLYGMGHKHGAAAEARMALESDGTNIQAAKVLVAAYKDIGKVKEAQAILERVSQMAPDDRDIEHLQRDLAAVQTMTQGFDNAKDFRDVLKNKQQAEELEKKQHLIQSDSDFTLVVENLKQEFAANPQDAKIPKKLGDLYFEKKKDWATARQWYQKAVQLAPQDSVLKDKVDDCQMRQYQAQVEAAQKANDPPKLKEALATSLKFKIQSFERRVTDRPTDMALRFELGTAYLAMGMVDKAIAEFQQAVKDPKRQILSLFNLGKAFHKKKLYDMADKQFAQAAEKVIAQEQKLDILYHRMVCTKEAGKKDQALQIGQQIMETDITYKDVAELVEKWRAEA
ncbi:MAG TPA: tetratricopeptide repeat protein, partial [Planctomycetota bacterium]|nr:tetratricopeptide repeat protein [Planctomycetota bacterium]